MKVVTLDYTCGSDTATDAVGYMVPCSPTYFSDLSGGTHFRIVKIRVMGEPASAASTLIVGAMNCSSRTDERLDRAKIYRYMRSLVFKKMGPVGGCVDWGCVIPNPMWVDKDDTSSDEVPQVMVGWLAAETTTSKAYFSIVITAEILE